MRAALVAMLIVATAGVSDAQRRKGGKAGKGKKKGKVVRVERARSAARGVVRVCTNANASASATCYGRPPVIDEPATIVDERGIRATGRVQSVTAIPDRCGNQSTFDVSLRIDSGDVSNMSWSAAMVFDYTLGAQSKVLQTGALPLPSPRPGEQHLTSVDDDGDGAADLLVTWYFCDASTAPTPGMQGGAYCLVYYEEQSGSLRERRIDVVPSCY